MRTALYLALAIAMFGDVATADDGPGRNIEDQRAWLSERLTERMTSADGILTVTRQLDSMTDRQIRELVAISLRGGRRADPKVAAVGRRFLIENRRRVLAQQRALGFGRQVGFVPNQGFGGYYFPRRVVAYQPVVTWLPTGASLNTAGTISSDGRYVRTGVQPYFSSIRAVHTYNLQTGETKRIR